MSNGFVRKGCPFVVSRAKSPVSGFPRESFLVGRRSGVVARNSCHMLEKVCVFVLGNRVVWLGSFESNFGALVPHDAKFDRTLSHAH